LCTSSIKTYPSSTFYSIFDFYNVANSGTLYPKVRIASYQNNNGILLDVDKTTNNVQIGICDDSSTNKGDVKIGGQNLTLYSKNNFKFQFTSHPVEFVSSTSYLQFKSSNYSKTASIQFGMTLDYTNANVYIAGSESGYPAVISNGIKLLTEANGDPLKITSTKYSNSEEIIIPYGLNMGLSSTEFSVYDDDETKNITFPKGLRMVTDGSYLRVWKPGTVIGADPSKDQIQINYSFRTIAALNCLVFYKPGDTIDSSNNSPNMIKMPWGITVKTDDTYLTILKPGDSTKGVKLAWQTL
jgi:hypothetical protein